MFIGQYAASLPLPPPSPRSCSPPPARCHLHQILSPVALRLLFRTVMTRPSIFTHLSRLPFFRGLLCPSRTRRCTSRTRRGRRLRWPRLGRLADRRWPDDHPDVRRQRARLLHLRAPLLPFGSDLDSSLAACLDCGSGACSWRDPTLRGLSVARGGLSCCCRCSRLLSLLAAELGVLLLVVPRVTMVVWSVV